jgi:DNA replication protein DnaC
VLAQLAALRTEQPGGSERKRALEALLEDAQERDRLAERLPSGCWCYGSGGREERAVLLPGDEVPMVLGVYCDCRVGQARKLADAELRQRAAAYRQELHVAGIWEGARIPERFATCTFATFPRVPRMELVVASLRRWMEDPSWAVVLHGRYGVGKTGLAISVLRAAAEAHHVGLFVKTPDLLVRIRATYGRDSETSEADVLDSLRTVDYLVLDDVGAEKVTDWATSMLFQVLDHRHDQQRKTILTTNLDVAGLGVHMGERTLRRFEEGALFLHLDGPNLRTHGGNS